MLHRRLPAEQPSFWRALCVWTAALSLATPGAAATGEQQKVALLVGVNEYAKPGFADLEYAESDVEVVGSALTSLGFDVHSLRGSKATRSEIERTARSLVSGLTKRDIAVVMLSGHGMQHDVEVDGVTRQDAFFCPYDSVSGQSESMLSLSLLTDDILATNVGNSFVLVDACRDNPRLARGKSAKGIDGSRVSLPAGVAVLFSCSWGQKSYELPEIKQGLFSHCVAEALRGAAGHRGVIDWDSVQGYVKRRMSGEFVGGLLPDGRRQTPISAGGAAYSELGRIRFAKSAGSSRLDNSLFMRFVYCPSPDDIDDLPSIQKSPSRSGGDGFWIGACEVTQSEWVRLMDSRPWSGSPGAKQDGRLPATYVSQADAVRFCARLTEAEHRENRLPSHECYRLPTEREWEHACRAGSTDRWWFGDDAGAAARYTHHRGGGASEVRFERRRVGPKPVGLLAANPWGLHDSHGNVAEWCSLAPGGSPTARAVARGGAWSDLVGDTASSSRRDAEPEAAVFQDVGFRVLRGPALAVGKPDGVGITADKLRIYREQAQTTRDLYRDLLSQTEEE